MKTKKLAETRNINIDILRIISMLLVVACHATIHLQWMLNGNVNNYSNAVKSLLYVTVHLGQVGVSIFFMISGYFLCKKKFSFSRITSVVVQTLSYTLTLLVIFYLVKDASFMPVSIKEMFGQSNIFTTVVHGCIPVLSNAYWFITVYVVMLLLSPFINAVVSNCDHKKLTALIAIMLLFNVWAIVIPYVNFFNAACYAVLCYILGAWVKIYGGKYKKIITVKRLLVLLIFSLLIMVIFNYVALSDNVLSSLLNWSTKVTSDNGLRFIEIIMAFVIFWKFTTYSRQIFSTKKSVLLRNISATIFGVYLIHENQFVYRFLWGNLNEVLSSFMMNVSLFIRLALTILLILGVFIVCLLISYIYHKVVVEKIVEAASNCHLIKTFTSKIDCVVN